VIKLAPIILFILVTCTSQNQQAEGFDQYKSLVDITDLYQAGQLQFERTIQDRPELDLVRQHALPSILFIFITIQPDEGEREQVQQSGVLVAGGRFVLTAGHGFEIDDGYVTEIQARTIFGHKLLLDLVRLSHDPGYAENADWAILKPRLPLQAASVESASGIYTEKEVLILGYPGGLGLDNSGNIVHVGELERGSAYPLGIICDRMRLSSHVLRPQVGTIPIQGMSGAPVLNQQGGLTGLLSSVSRSRSFDGWHYILGVSDIPWIILDSLTAK
jgi:hypothetical protein